METFSVLIGFLIGVIAAAIAVELGLKKLFMPPNATKLTSSWRLDEVESPLAVAVDAADVQLPEGARIITAGRANADAYRGREHRRHVSARGNFIVHPEKDRALLFLGPMAPGTMALSTVDPQLCERLRVEHRRLWTSGDDYIEEIPLAEAVGRQNVMLRTRGVVQEVVPYKGRHLMRLADDRNVIGVIVESPLDLAGATVVVTGRAQRGTSGYTLLEAIEVRRITKPTAREAARASITANAGANGEAAAPHVADEPVVERPRAPPAPRKEEAGVLRIPRERIEPKVEPAAPEPAEAPMPPEPAEPVPRSEAEKMRREARVVVHR